MSAPSLFSAANEQHCTPADLRDIAAYIVEDLAK